MPGSWRWERLLTRHILLLPLPLLFMSPDNIPLCLNPAKESYGSLCCLQSFTMAFFENKYEYVLYVANDGGAGKGFLAFIIPEWGASPGKDIELEAALHNPFYKGTFIFSAVAPALGTPAEAKAFYDYFKDKVQPGDRAILEVHNIADPHNIEIDSMSYSEARVRMIMGGRGL